MRTRGFTLVELLVVIAIIAILAAMIAPVLLQAKEASRMRVCASNLKQLGTAITRYMDDNGGYGLPPSPDEYLNAWILCVLPLVPNYLPASREAAKVPRENGGVQNDSYHPPKLIWVCSGDLCQGTEYSDAPYWFNYGSSYLYPGPTAYLSGTSEWTKIPPPTPYKPLQWRNLKRDILLADYWFGFHGGRKVKNERMKLTPPAWVSVSDTKSVNVLFLDLHLQACTAAEREKYREFTIRDDNPHYQKEDSP
jgi:prepilin-type N-terminal cleavage/methylation domain-containing protein